MPETTRGHILWHESMRERVTIPPAVASDVFALIAQNDALVAELHALDEKIAAVGFTPKQFRLERLRQWKLLKAQKVERHKELVARIKKLSPSAQPV